MNGCPCVGQNRAGKLLHYLGNVIVNGPSTPLVTDIPPAKIKVLFLSYSKNNTAKWMVQSGYFVTLTAFKMEWSMIEDSVTFVCDFTYVILYFFFYCRSRWFYTLTLFIDPFLLLSIFLLLKSRRKRYGTDTFPKSFFIERTTFRKAADSTKRGPEFEFRWGTRVCLCRGRYGTVHGVT